MVTADAPHCHRGMAKEIAARGGDYFLMSRGYSPQQVLRIVRTHWTIENGLHRPRDVVPDEELARNRKDNAPANLAVLRRSALNVARAHPDTQISLRAELKRAGWDDASSSNSSVTCDSPALQGQGDEKSFTR